MKINDHVKVDFISESSTEFSGKRFTGEGVVDRVEDGRVFGRLDKQLKNQLNNMEQCYIGKKKQVDAIEHVLGCAMIGPKEVFMYAERIQKALRVEHDSFADVSQKAEDQINNGARITKHRIDL